MSLAWANVRLSKLMDHSSSDTIYDKHCQLSGVIYLSRHNCEHVLVQVLVKKLAGLAIVHRKEVLLQTGSRLLIVLGFNAHYLLVST